MNRRLVHTLPALVLIIGLLPLALPASAADCIVTVTATLVNNTGEERTGRIRIIDTNDNGRIVANTEAVFALNETRTLTLTADVAAGYMILLNRAGMRLTAFDTAFTGAPEVCDAVQVFIGDGRINAGLNQNAAPLAAYCTRRGGIDVYDINNQGEGTLAFRVTAQQIADALALTRQTGLNQKIGEGLFNALYALTTSELQLQGIFDYNPADSGKVYNFIMPGDTCAVK
ncbi:MAG: hypothetical protein L6Q98_17565 [Anaerolineae bacterium]|nr:hypothetical protein [Anaerolineae bacterium]NUQ05257.1 hypothetical protein [Anaerolineae bacterium]